MCYKYKLLELICSNFAISFKYKAFQEIFFKKKDQSLNKTNEKSLQYKSNI
jgi:hypothetical protein